jgi:uncharacterized phage-associated protein
MVEYNNLRKTVNTTSGDIVSQIINPSTPGKERNRLSKAIVITIRAFMRQEKPDKNTKDMLAFIILALREISDGIDKSVTAWEKRGYWIKADKYRMEWEWTSQYADQLHAAFKNEKWSEISALLMQTMGRFSDIKVSDKHRMGKPWIGALKQYQA